MSNSDRNPDFVPFVKEYFYQPEDQAEAVQRYKSKLENQNLESDPKSYMIATA
jgi:hypothetical protein